MREASNTSLKLGLYEPMKSVTGADKPNASIWSKFAAGALSGGLGCFAGNPFDVLKTRMMADEGKGRGIGSFGSEVYKTQGFAGFYKGLQANIARACVLNATKMGCYDECKKKIKQSGYVKEGIPL
jgi:solute carrier family 25 protein 14/30